MVRSYKPVICFAGNTTVQAAVRGTESTPPDQSELKQHCTEFSTFNAPSVCAQADSIRSVSGCRQDVYALVACRRWESIKDLSLQHCIHTRRWKLFLIYYIFLKMSDPLSEKFSAGFASLSCLVSCWKCVPALLFLNSKSTRSVVEDVTLMVSF